MPKLIKKISKPNYRLLAVGYTLWLTVVSLTPLDGLNLPSFSYVDKIIHFFLYFFLTLLWLFAYPKWRRKPVSFIILIILWGIGIECIQEYFVPTRSGDVFDALANTIGVLSGLFSFIWFNPYYS